MSGGFYNIDLHGACGHTLFAQTNLLHGGGPADFLDCSLRNK